MQSSIVRAQERRSPEWGWFLAWLAVGGCLALGLAALLSVGVVLVVLATPAAVFLFRKGHRTAVVGALAGPALPLFYLAYLNRGGPGDVCRTTATGLSCTDEYTPVPFLVGGVLLVAAGLLAFLVLDRRRRATN